MVLILCSTSAMGYLAQCEIFESLETSVSLTILFSFTTLLGCITVLSQLCVQYSDPGILTNRNPGADSDDFRAQCLDLEEDEREVFDSDPIYQNSMYYKFRNCSTCQLARTPKASHCDRCGHCVQGWDHHCVALNNCVGVRNIRSFVIFLIVSFIFASFTFISCFTLMMIDRTYAPSSFRKRLGTGLGLLIALLTFILTVKPWFRNSCRLIIVINGYVLAMVLTMLYCRDAPSFLAGATIYTAIGYTLVIRSMLCDYLEVVSQHLNTKEKKARLQYTKEQCINRDNDFKNKEVPTSLKARRCLHFFCKKIPASSIGYHEYLIDLRLRNESSKVDDGFV